MKIKSSFQPSFIPSINAIDRQSSGASFAAVHAQMAASTGALSATTDDAASSSGYDFTNMSPNEMREAMNNMISSGKMSLDDSTGLVTLIPSSLSVVDGNTASLDQPTNFLSLTQDAIAGAQWRGDHASVAYLTRGLDILNANQKDIG
ncbi:hypothetical protein ABQW55_011180 [Xanthomonas citri pv. malvacearum]|uniref:Uncharacterized protein n=1 Tax=Xanthomonas campestris pv. malvacearum TaxID=86040 RepID=A0AA44YXQ4_XANCM|nr:hypothetical protein [Xanthomonas citri]ASN01338.1 hypothetical protein APY29_11065 [Xanthomonas citri pv. malvacearum]ASN09524.1 hypothetical protein APY30_10865 [Xanthomonas citri pv. malvacearum]ASY84603.1 hypothetical protein CIW71_11835 [Xanthomonas citri pv. malvacearum]MCC4631126.1 hypothetical protein [Xanthomonas citri]NMI15853.1 hypothetical protein [Xanthomonas citri]